MTARSSWPLRVIRLFLGGMFIWASIPKIASPSVFLGSVYQYELLPPAAANVVAITLPWLEFVTGICLLAGVGLGGAMLCAFLACSAFLVAQASVIYRGLEIDCGCNLLPGSSRVTYLTLARSLFLMLCAGAGYALAWRRASSDIAQPKKAPETQPCEQQVSHA